MLSDFERRRLRSQGFSQPNQVARRNSSPDKARKISSARMCSLPHRARRGARFALVAEREAFLRNFFITAENVRVSFVVVLFPGGLQLPCAGMASPRLLFQDVTHFGGKLIRAERFLYEVRSRIQHSDIDRGVLCVGRHIEDLQIRP
jgi:hypothetical protein